MSATIARTIVGIGLLALAMLGCKGPLGCEGPKAPEAEPAPPAPAWMVQEAWLRPGWGPIIRRYHDNGLAVTCWTSSEMGSGIHCIPDWQLRPPGVEALP